MTEIKHTPGPWRVEDGTTLIWGKCNPDDISSCGMGYPVAEARTRPVRFWAKRPDYDEGEANARLIAAAPELLEVAKACREVCLFGDDDGIGVSEDVVIPSALFDRICAAINKAEGRS